MPDFSLLFRSLAHLLGSTYKTNVGLGLLAGMILDGGSKYLQAVLPDNALITALASVPWYAWLGIGIFVLVAPAALKRRPITERTKLQLNALDEAMERANFSQAQRNMAYSVLIDRMTKISPP